MPWKNLTYEQTVSAYKELFLDIRDLTDIDITIKGFLIRSEIFRHDFTKRQILILLFIVTYSYLYGKEWALIPKLRDFELCGIGRTHIKKELVKLQGLNVLKWNQEENLYGVKDPRVWGVPYNASYNDDRNKEIISINLNHAGIDIESLREKIKKLK
ncbi:MAG: replication protein [Methanobacterium sp.]